MQNNHAVDNEPSKVKDFQKVINIAEKYDMPCLGFIDTIEDTYFNKGQCEDIQKELETIILSDKQYYNCQTYQTQRKRKFEQLEGQYNVSANHLKAEWYSLQLKELKK